MLPFQPARFRAESVTDRPGDWGPLFDDLVGAAKADGDLVILKNGGKLADPFAATNVRLVEEALAIAAMATGAAVPAGRAFATIVWEGAPRGDRDYTQGFADLARASRLTVAEVSTAPNAARAPRR